MRLLAPRLVLEVKKSVMGPFTASRGLLMLGWIGTAVMAAAAVCMLIPG